MESVYNIENQNIHINSPLFDIQAIFADNTFSPHKTSILQETHIHH